MVYYVEDDKNIRELTVYALGQGGIEARGCADDAEFRRACAERTPDAVLLDIMLPDADGLEILARLRRTPGLSHVPVMMLTAKDTELDTVKALDSGADDYLSKPFGMMEMVSRTRALLRRSGRETAVQEKPASLVSGDVTLWPDRREVTAGDREVQLTMREFDLLEFLMRSPGVVFSRETLRLGLGLRRRLPHRRRARAADPSQARRLVGPYRDRARRRLSRPRIGACDN